jgi:cell division protein FtsB
VAAGLAAYGLLLFKSPQGIPALLGRWNEIRRLEAQNAALHQQNQAQRAKINRLRESPSEQEFLIRKELKLLREGETQFILPEAPKTPEPDRP